MSGGPGSPPSTPRDTGVWLVTWKVGSGRLRLTYSETVGSWTLLDAVEDLVVPDDFAGALAAARPAAADERASQWRPKS